MDEHRATGTAKNLGGKIEEGIGRIAGDMQTQAKGQAKQMQGAAEDLYGQAKDAAGSITDIVRSTIEERPYTAVAIALGTRLAIRQNAPAALAGVRLAERVLAPADRNSDKEPYAEGNPNGCQGMLFGLFADPV